MSTGISSTDSFAISLTVDVPLESIETYRLLEVCPSGYLPKSVTKQLIYSTSSSAGSTKLTPDNNTPVPPYPFGTRLRFHFITTISGTGKLVDDSRQSQNGPCSRSKPMEMIIGRGFVLEIWEVALNTMKEGEISRFMVPKEMCTRYPLVAQIIRDLTKTRNYASLAASTSFFGGGTSQSQYENRMETESENQDLIEFRRVPQDLTFTFELLEVCLPGEYNIAALYNVPVQSALLFQGQPIEQDNLHDSVVSLERKADKLLVSKDYQGAATKYSEALLRVDQPQSVNTEDLEDQQKKKVSLLMKSAYCKLNSKNYSESLELLTAVLEMNPDNPMALFRRGKCYVQTANFTKARKDFTRVLELDPTYQKAVRPELSIIDTEERKATNPNRI